MNKKKAYIIPHTHWDREWRYPIWKNRKLLLEFFDNLLDILDNDKDYNNFLLDGQCAPVEDYLEIRPEKREKVEKYIKEGKISTGPWYTLPDLYPVDGESLVRNLLKGRKLTEQYGAGLKVAYMTFGWGQTAQLPQIYDGFGLDFIICAKKVSDERAPNSEFLWEAPDGTKVLTSRLGDHSRANLFFNAYIDTRYGVSFFSDQFRYTPERTGQAMHSSTVNKQSEDYFVINPKEHWDTEGLKERLLKSIEGTDSTLLPDVRLLLNGCDFSSPQPELTKFIKDAEKALPEWEFVNASLEEYATDLKCFLEESELKTIKGELRDGPSCDCSGNALASRIPVKQLNKVVQRLYFRKAEPLNALLSLIGLGENDQLLPTALKFILDSHPHDSINGVTQDKTFSDVMYRLSQAEEICQVVYDRSMEKIIKNIDMSNYEINDQILFLFNPSPQSESSTIEICVDTPADSSIWNFDFIDTSGNPVQVQHVSRIKHNTPVHDLEARPWPYTVHRHKVWLKTPDIPAYGYTLLKMRPRETFHTDRYYSLPMRKSSGNYISPADNILENKYLLIIINPNGTIDMFDKEQTKWFRDLHYFEDSGDVGTYWTFYEPYENRILTSIGSQVVISQVTNGPLCGEYQIEWNIPVPERADEPDYGVEGPSRRSEKTVNMKIVSIISLKIDSRCAEIHTVVSNRSRCHRLRVAFPTGIDAVNSSASGHFTVDQRPINPVKDNSEFYPEMQTLPMQEFVDISDGTNGFALLNKGLTEYEIRPDNKHTAYLTLFRAVNNMIVTGWRAVNRFPEQDGSQLLQDMHFDYAIYPHKGNYSDGFVYKESRKFSTEISSYQVCGTSSGSFPVEKGFMELKPDNLILSAVKLPENGKGVVFRIYNPTDQEITGTIKVNLPVKSVSKLRLDELFKENLKIKDGVIEISIQAFKIVTLKLEND